MEVEIFRKNGKSYITTKDLQLFLLENAYENNDLSVVDFVKMINQILEEANKTS